MKKIKQVSVFIENKPGRLLEVLELLARENVNIKALSLADTSDFGIVRLIVNDTEKALTVLRSNKFTASDTMILATVVEDKPGSLAQILKIFSSHGINIEYMYGFTSPMKGKAIMVFRLSDAEAGEKVLIEHDIPLITENDLREI